MEFLGRDMSFRQRQYLALITMALIPILITLIFALPMISNAAYRDHFEYLDLVANLKAAEILNNYDNAQAIGKNIDDEYLDFDIIRIYLVEENGVIINLQSSEADDLSQLQGTQAAISAVLQEQDGRGIFKEGNQKILAAYRWLDDIQVGLIIEVDHSEVGIEYLNIWFCVLFTEAIALLLVFVGASRITAKLMKPLARIIKATEAIKNGQLHKRVEVSGSDEIGQLAIAFNTMADSIQHNQKHLEDLILERTKQLHQKQEQLESEIEAREIQVSTLQNNENLLKKIFEALPDSVFILNLEYVYQDVLRYHEHTYLQSPDKMIGKTLYDLYPKPFADFCKQVIQDTLLTNQIQVVEYNAPIGETPGVHAHVQYNEGRIIPFDDPHTGERQVLWFSRDITARKQAEQSLIRSNRAFKLLSDCNRVVIRAVDEKRLFINICQTITQSEYPLAWIGIKQNNLEKTILPIAQAGCDADTRIKQMPMTWMDNELGQTPTGIAMRTGSSSIINDMSHDSRYEAWQRLHSDCTLLSWAALPLVLNDEVAAVLNIYAKEKDAFTLGELSLLMDMVSEVAYGLEMLRIQEEQHIAERELNEYSERLQSLTQQLMLAQEQERHRISRELHDDIGQALTALKISLKITENTIPTELDDLKHRIADLVDLADTTLEQVRVVAQDLRPAALDTIGLIPTIQSYCKEFSRRTNLNIEFHQINDIPKLSDVASTALYRITQEALTNIIKHADAQNSIVTLEFDGNYIRLEIADDGRGMDAQEVDKTDGWNGIGMLGMIERIELLGGTFNVQSIVDKGTRLTIAIPNEGE